MNLIYFSSAFCDPCIQTRAILREVAELVSGVRVAELDVALDVAEAERADIRVTPTIIVVNDSGEEVFRAEGVPTLNQVLVALAKAV
jgi:thioredoxin 1